MSRFVDIEPIIKDLTAMKKVYDAIALDGMIKALREAPTADVVEVVRCKDCLNAHLINNYPYCELWSFVMAHDNFCSFGKRKVQE